MSVFNSTLCEITWTDAVHDEEHFVFAREQPLELRFGLSFDPAFWASFVSSQWFLQLHMIRNGGVLTVHQHSGNTLELPGAPTEELWLGVSFGQATQATSGSSDVIGFRPVIFFQRQSSNQNIAREFAVARDIHYFCIDPFLPFDDFSSPSVSLVGGRGRPDE